MATWPQIRAGIFAGESGGDYDALFGFSNRQGGPFQNARLTNMTVDQALNFASPSGPYAQYVKGKVGRVATPLGAYQVVGSTLKAAKQGLGLTGNERMDQATQDRIGQWILANQGTGAWEGYKGPGDPNKYANMPDGPKGQEVYTPQPDMTMVASTGPTGPDGQAAADYYNSMSDEEKEKAARAKMWKGILGSLSEFGDGPAHARMGQMGDARQSGGGLLELLGAGGNPYAAFARKQRGILG